jgi:hypothetical protein
LDWRVERIVLLGKNVARCFGFRDLPFLAEIRILRTPLLDLSASFWHQSVVERTTRSTTSAAIPTGRDSSGWIPREWRFHSDAVADKFDRRVREQLPWYDLAAQAVAHFARLTAVRRLVDRVDSGSQLATRHSITKLRTNRIFSRFGNFVYPFP